MICPNCNTEVRDGAKFCEECGTPLAAPKEIAEDAPVEDAPVEAEGQPEAKPETELEAITEDIAQPPAEEPAEEPPAVEEEAEEVKEAEEAAPATTETQTPPPPPGAATTALGVPYGIGSEQASTETDGAGNAHGTTAGFATGAYGTGAAPIPPNAPTSGYATAGRGKSGTAALVCGIIAIVCALTFVLFPVGIVLGIVAIVLSRKSHDGKAKGGLVCGIVGLVLSALLLFATVAIGTAVVSLLEDPTVQAEIAESLDDDELDLGFSGEHGHEYGYGYGSGYGAGSTAGYGTLDLL